MARRRYHAQCLRATDGTSARCESSVCSRNENKENDGHLGTESNEVPPVEVAERVEGYVLIKETLLEYCLASAKKAL